MFDDNYTIPAKGIPFVAYQKECRSEAESFIFTHLHYHSDFEILFITEGHVQMKINDAPLEANSGDILLINPFDVHYGVSSHSYLSYYCLDFNIKMLDLPDETALLSEEIKYRHIIHAPLSEQLSQHLKAATCAYLDEPAGWQLVVRGSLLLFFSALSDWLYSSAPNKNNIFTKTVLKFIDDNYALPITSREAAEALSYNQSHFCRLFRKSFTTSFSSFLNEYRIKKAKEFLHEHNVSQAAAMAGFNDQSYFSQTFKKSAGVSPTDYKKMISSTDAR